ncbi:nucleoside triphosphatase YtkD [Salibacterium salarium]|uniref:Nucleoside triphosphatase YtkD n=1 Tax=Salibacterium salarium TaxID=284579 RepID=A0A428N0L6_9BACI|nr:nucleoside triphosphatase YtkD [Salibacterium salarium]RSL31963.1 nucleoside triphosphatase YtkD [Salibacterium salarium]
MKKFTFLDYYHNEVQLAFERTPFSSNPGHVWIVCRYDKKWLLTHHPRRGLEFPGGKIERDEKPEQAAIREIWEETGGEVDHIVQVGQYMVQGKAETVVKNIYFAEIKNVIEKSDYMETKGPVLQEVLPDDMNHTYSFIMRDEVLPRTLQYLETRKLLHPK